MDRDELAAIRARVEAASDAYFDHLAPRCGHTFVGEGLNCGLSSGHDGPHSRRPPANDGWRYMNETRQDVLRLCDEVARLTAEVERLGAMVPRWVNVGTDRAVWRLRVAGQDVVIVQLESKPNGRWYEWPTSVVHPDLPTACAAVCRRLGLPYIAPPENTNV